MQMVKSSSERKIKPHEIKKISIVGKKKMSIAGIKTKVKLKSPSDRKYEMVSQEGSKKKQFTIIPKTARDSSTCKFKTKHFIRKQEGSIVQVEAILSTTIRSCNSSASELSAERKTIKLPKNKSSIQSPNTKVKLFKTTSSRNKPIASSQTVAIKPPIGPIDTSKNTKLYDEFLKNHYLDYSQIAG